MAADVDDDLDDEEAPEVPANLAAAAEELLTLAAQTRVLHRDVSHTDRLFDVLRLLGRLHEFCLTEAGYFAPDPTPTDDEERAWMAERELAFVRRCADGLAEVAAACVSFAVPLWVDLRPDWEEVADARAEVVEEAREELLGELGILGGRSAQGRPLRPIKHDVGEFLRPTLLFVALGCADAAYELNDAHLPGTAGVTMLGVAASLLTDGDEVATAASYASWPGLEDGSW